MGANYYENIALKEIINSTNFTLNDDSIKVSVGEIYFGTENEDRVIKWNIPDNTLKTGSTAILEFQLSLVSEQNDEIGYFPLSKEIEINARTSDGATYDLKSNETPILKHGYQVTYDANAPEGCKVTAPNSFVKFSYDLVDIENANLVCEGYSFAGWKIKDQVEIINETKFVMPPHDVTVVGTWSKVGIVTTADGSIVEKATLYKVIEGKYRKGDSSISLAPTDSSIVENGDGNVYYYSNNANDNNVVFGGFCWKAFRTTKNGGTKLIYNGDFQNGSCYGDNIQIGKTNFATNITSFDQIDYSSSHINKYLNTWFEKNLGKYKSLLFENWYYVDMYDKDENTYQFDAINRNTYFLGGNVANDNSIGLLSVDEYKMICGNTSDCYLNGRESYFTNSFYSYDEVNRLQISLIKEEGGLTHQSSEASSTVRPVIVLNNNAEYIGSGTENNPYLINDDIYIKSSSELEVGDYVSMASTVSTYTIDSSLTGLDDNQVIYPKNNSLWQIIQKNADGTLELINVSYNANMLKINVNNLNSLDSLLDDIAKQYENSFYTDASYYPNQNILNKIAFVNNTSYWLKSGYFVDSAGKAKSVSFVEDEISYAVRPIVLLKKDLIFAGRGSEIEPWQVQKKE